MYRTALKMLATATLLVASGSALAGIINFDFTGGPGGTTTGNLSFTSGGVTVTAAAWARDTSGDYVSGRLGHYSNGLGVTNGPNDNSHTVDNSGWEDYVKFVFDQAVTVTRVSVWPYGDIDISYNFDVGTTNWYSQNATVNGNPTHIALSTTMLSRYFRLGAVRGNDSNDAFKIAGLRIETVTRQVPEPGPLSLLGVGLLALGLIRRRRA